MKTYKFSVEVPEFETNNSFMESLLDECSNEHKQLALTHKVNKETTKIHREILISFVAELDEQLKKVGLEFGNVNTITECGTNCYETSVATLFIGHQRFNVGIKAINDRSFKDSKYTTFTGEYELFMGWRESNTCFEWSNCLERKITTTDEVFDYIKIKLKEYIKQNKIV